MSNSSFPRMAAVLTALALLAGACGGASETNTQATPESATPAGASDSPGPFENASEIAANNIGNLAPNDDVRLIEVLDVDTGETTTLAEVVDGDRPVLLWFWAPH